MNDKLELWTEHDILKAFSHVVDKLQSKKLKLEDTGLFINCLNLTPKKILFSTQYYFVIYNFSENEIKVNAENGLFENRNEYNIRLDQMSNCKDEDNGFINYFSIIQTINFPNVQKLIDEREIKKDFKVIQGFDIDYLMNYFKFCKSLYSKKEISYIPVDTEIINGKQPSKFSLLQTELYLMPVFRKED